jgi:hypothetical protein
MPKAIRERTDFLVLPIVYVNNIPLSDLTPSVLNCLLHNFSNVGATTVTNFTNGTEGQTIRIKGDGFTTIKNNTTIKTNTAADKLLAANTIYTLTLISGVWYEDA